MLNLKAIRALTFDCYGTLIDWEAGLLAVLRPWAVRHGLRVSDGDLLAAFAQAEPACEAATPAARYSDILRAVQHKLAAHFGTSASAAEADTLARSVGDWPAFADTPEALRELKRHFKLVVVSNVDHASFARTRPKLGIELDALVTAEDVGAYKPDRRMFERAFATLAGLGVQRAEVLHVAESLYHDHVPAKALGLPTVWIHRRAGRSGPAASRTPDAPVKPDLEFGALGEFAAQVRRTMQDQNPGARDA